MARVQGPWRTEDEHLASPVGQVCRRVLFFYVDLT